MIKNIIIIVASSVTCGYIGYKIGAKKAQKFADEQVNSTKESLKNYYEQKLSEKDEEIKKIEEVKNDMGVDPGINDDNDPTNVFKDPREQFPKPFEAVQSKYYKLDPNIKVKIQEHMTTEKVDNGVYKIPEKDMILKRPNDLPPTAIDTPDGYPDPDDINVEPYLIRDVDYGTIDKFDMQELVLWSCGTVTTDDASYDIVSPTYLFRLLPEGWTNMFGWGNSDKYVNSLYFRNNKEKKDIQITKQSQPFKEWVEATCPGRLDELEED